MKDYRPELPQPIPDRIRRLPVDRGYPVPRFVQWVDGKPDFRIMDHDFLLEALNGSYCWVCGTRFGRHRAYVIGPMCAINRTSAEPPSHVDCAEWSAKACPFLTRPHARRREAGLPDEETSKGAGMMIERNPGVAGVWKVESSTRTKSDGRGGLLFDIGDPSGTTWWCEGREATRAEVDESIEAGLPALRETCSLPRAHRLLDAHIERAQAYLPA